MHLTRLRNESGFLEGIAESTDSVRHLFFPQTFQDTPWNVATFISTDIAETFSTDIAKNFFPPMETNGIANVSPKLAD